MKEKKMKNKLLPLMISSALGLGAMPMAHAATINVGGGCSLVDAITAANTDSATGGCSAGNGADTIELESSTTYTLTVVNNSTDGENGLPSISSEIIINGN
ncbi:secreted protein, partial [Candidatus Thiomargarita nelsonii]